MVSTVLERNPEVIIKGLINLDEVNKCTQLWYATVCLLSCTAISECLILYSCCKTQWIYTRLISSTSMKAQMVVKILSATRLGGLFKYSATVAKITFTLNYGKYIGESNYKLYWLTARQLVSTFLLFTRAMFPRLTISMRCFPMVNVEVLHTSPGQWLTKCFKRDSIMTHRRPAVSARFYRFYTYKSPLLCISVHTIVSYN